ncbi:MAG: T9SS type A sorting domain-containing protein [Bacteroidia bacterium]|nr:T9SS type A sorting domain-containing protein [Bacteroidia bacterium]MBP7259656.1 T9SS type A sorting domain-containing protein [Bacteroidia bacterium]MBP9179353.1 T9SS type A sorting domain-containing protein [Bacteroidia bacterium]MBP9723393.1 T9SS type A sorting domain-containing protein [Bacteroidia bacterium]
MKTKKYLLISGLILLGLAGYGQNVVYVKKTATGSNNGTSWTNAYTDLRTALTNAASGAQVWVAADTFYLTSAQGRNTAFEITNKSLTVYGGFPNTGNPTIGNRAPSVYHTILSGDISKNDPTFSSSVRKDDANRQDNAYNVIRISLNGLVPGTVIIDGFTIQDGNANSGSDGNGKWGAGIHYSRNANGSSSHTISVKNCVFRNNTAVSSAAIGTYLFYVDNGAVNLVIQQNKFYNNVADEWAVMGLHTPGTNGTTGYAWSFYSNAVYRNISLNNDGAILGAVCRNNTSSGSSFNYKINWNTFAYNTQGNNGGVVCAEGTQGISPSNFSQMIATNNIFWGNAPAKAFNRRAGARNFSANSYIVYNMAEVADSFLSTPSILLNTLSDPEFVNAAGNNFRLSPCSKAINAGNDMIPDGSGGSFSASNSSKDVEDNTRIQHGTVDLGAYEFFGTLSGPSSAAVSASICPGSSYSFKGQNLTTPGIYRDTLNNAGGCDSVVTLTLTLKPNTNDTLSFVICEGDSFKFNNIYYKQTGFYSGNFTNIYGCDSIKTINLTVNNKPQPNIVRIGNQLEVTGGPFDSYQWKLNGNNITGANSATHTPVSNGTYSVSVSKSANSISCNNTSADYSVGFVGLEEFNLLTGVTFYPNPTKGLLTVEVSEPSTIVIMNLLGKVLISEAVTDKSILNLQHLPKGIYFICETNKKAVSKIVLQ